ncbi:M20/M25/M40 family metallo-hydrolase [Novosphingobium sp. B 225]|uniref:M20/M25/M40 family metallo-hydrolase n=1 Tax=Novosphingobium sp. B 225 TaxID=1961849 RepID=UPI000B4B5CBE|nr:M20/M25/M40 family metallo-hydrolase [Novosphingobium sp. B 225]
MTRRLLTALAAFALSAPLSAQEAIDPDNLTATVRTMAGDWFQGRAPGTLGEERTVGYLIGRLQALGLQPGGPDGAWTQQVPLLHTRLGTPQSIELATPQGTLPLGLGTDVYLSTLRGDDVAKVANAPLVFVGYGVTAPERKWDDFKGQDLKGKVAVFLINDPDFSASHDEKVWGKFGGKTMTYYGRWTYKFEEAARRGAVAALIVHDAEGVGYGWNVITSPGGENYGLVRKDGAQTSLAVQGWLAHDLSDKLFAMAGQDLAKLRIAARSAKFKPVPLDGVTLSAAIPSTHEVVTSQNVLARLPGSKRPDEVVMLGAHWDAYGQGKPDAQGRIYRAGANDDALGVAGVLEVARRMVAAPTPQRSVVFGFWTAEERGLLGSEAYAQDPVYPMAKTVANLTIDVLQTAGRARDVVLIGKGQSSMEDELLSAATKQGRTVTDESLPERGLFYRADHFPMAKRGVPVLLMMGLAGASDIVEGGKAAGQAWIDDYTGRCYHQACDAWDAKWNLDGAVQDIELVDTIATDLANSTRWPAWKPGSEFAAARGKVGK